MLIKTINDNAEKTLLANLESQQNNSIAANLMHCLFSNSAVRPLDSDGMIILLKDILKDRDGVLYYFSDGDIFIRWIGAAKDVMEAIKQEIQNIAWRRSQTGIQKDFSIIMILEHMAKIYGLFAKIRYRN